MKKISTLSLLWISVPSILSLSLEPIAEMIDTVFAGSFHVTWVSSLAVTNTFFISLVWILSFLPIGVVSVVASFYGRGENILLAKKITGYLFITAIIGIVISFILFLIEAILFKNILGLSSNLISTLLPYWRMRILGFPFTLLVGVSMGVLRGLQKFFLSFILSLLITSINIIVTYIGLFIFSGGLESIAFGTVLSFAVGSFASIIYFYKKGFISFTNISLMSVLTDIVNIIKDTYSLFIRTCLLTLSFFLMTFFIGRMDEKLLAAHQITLQLWLFASFFLDGLAITANSKGAFFIASGENISLKIIVYKLLSLGFLCGVIISALYAIFFDEISLLFTRDKNVHNALASLVLAVIILQPLNGLVYVFDGILLGMKDYKFMKKIIFTGFLSLFLPCSFLSFFLFSSFQGIWFSLILMNIFRCFCSILRVKKYFTLSLINSNS